MRMFNNSSLQAAWSAKPRCSLALLISFAAWLCLVPLSAQAQPPLPVSVVQPHQAVPTFSLSLTGDLVAAQRANLSSRVEGLVSDMRVDVGDRVEQGDILLTLDATQAEYLLQQRTATAAEAQADYDENRRLVEEAERLTKNNHLPQTELDLRKAALATATARLDAARAEEQAQRARVDWHQLKAPFSGVISRKQTETGEWITPGTAVLTLVSTDRVYLDVQLPQERFAQLNTASTVRIMPDTNPGQVVTGRIAAVVPVSESGSRTFRVRLITSPTKPGTLQPALLPGTSARATFEFTQSTENALLIPRDALLRSPDGSFSVFVVVDHDGRSVAERRKLNLGLQTNGAVEVLEGLLADDKVVIRGNEILHHGQAVKVL